MSDQAQNKPFVTLPRASLIERLVKLCSPPSMEDFPKAIQYIDGKPIKENSSERGATDKDKEPRP